MRVVHLIHGEFYAGAEKVQDHIFSGLNEKEDVDLTVLLYKSGVYLDRSPLSEQVKYEALQGNKLLSLVRFLKGIKPDVVHCHSPVTLMLVLLTRFFGSACKSVVYHVHSPAIEDTESRLKNILKNAIEKISIFFLRPYVIGVSKTVLLRSNISCENSLVIPNGVPSQSVVIPDEELPMYLYFAGLIRPRKGFDILVRSVSILDINIRKKIIIKVFGEFESKEYKQHIYDLIHELSIQDNFEFLGFVSDVQAELGPKSLFVIPSMYGEGMPMVMLEAMSVGSVVVASNVGGINDVIEDGKDGLLFEAGNFSALGGVIEKCFSDSFNITELSRNAMSKQRESYSTSVMNEKLISVYRALL